MDNKPNKDIRKNFTLRLPVELHRRLKIASFENDTTMNEYIIKLIETALDLEEKKSEDK